MWERKPISKIEDPLQIAWLAGILEGEGCFGFYRKKATVAITMTDEDVIARVSLLMKTRYSMQSRRKENWKDTYSIRLSSSKAVYIMATVLPFMGTRRSAKINEILALHTTAQEERLRKLKCPSIPINELILRWQNWDETQSFRAFAREIGLHPENLRRQLKNANAYVR